MESKVSGAEVFSRSAIRAEGILVVPLLRSGRHFGEMSLLSFIHLREMPLLSLALLVLPAPWKGASTKFGVACAPGTLERRLY